MPLPRRLPFSPHIRPLHAVTYLLGVSLFSISFLVFLNSTLSFVLTDLLHRRSHLGNDVGTLGFADELVAIFAAPFWGALSDGKRIGARGVVVLCYLIVAISLIVFVNVSSVYPGLLLVRMMFSVGAAGVATMVSAMLPEMTGGSTPRKIVVTPPSESACAPIVREAGVDGQRSGRLAGLVGLCTGCGALLALGVFLPLPTRYAHYGKEEAVRRAFYTVAGTAVGVAGCCYLGLPRKQNGGRRLRGCLYNVTVWVWTKIWGGSPETVVLPSALPSPSAPAETLPHAAATSWIESLTTALHAARSDTRLSLAYLGGFVARATSVGVSLFVPLFVNAYFTQHGLCPPPAEGSPRETCHASYVLAAKLTGATQLTALLLAPVFGFWTDAAASALAGGRNTPLVTSAVLGVLGFTGFATLVSPDPQNNPVVWVYAVLMGAAQIGGIVCSLGLLGRAVASSPEETPLLSEGSLHDRRDVKGGIAGVYSLCGGVGILALTKVGGWGFDSVGSGWPFYMLAGFEAVLILVGVLEGVWGTEGKGRRRERER